jgi:superfamily II DNA/RNA helicase
MRLTDITTAAADEHAHADHPDAEPVPQGTGPNVPAPDVRVVEADAPENAVPNDVPVEPAAELAPSPGALADAAGPVADDSISDAEAAYNDEGEAEPNGFADLGLSPEIYRAVEDMGYRTPTPIQAQAIPPVLMGRDVLGCAQTGTGKTASFVLPMLDILSGSRARARMPRSLILEPTRELALQVAENFVKYGKYLKLNHALLIGGESLSDQKEALMKGVDVLIATPGRLMDLFERGGLLLTDTKILVIDEADRMLDMGFIPDVEKIVGFLPRTRQTLFFSATMAPEIRRLADAFLQNPKEITVSRPASVASTIVAGLTVVDALEKREALRRLIRSEDVQNALIFCNRKRDVDVLFKSLKQHGFSVGSLHGDMSQPERFATLGRFKANEVRLLVCSDVAARGLDIGGLSHVFNFDVPIHAEDYVHRIGRTGRAGMTGHAFTLATPDDKGFVDAIEKLIGAPIPRMQVEGLDPVEFAEGDGRRRGRGRGTKAAPRSAKAVADVVEASGDEVPKAAKPRRSRAKKADVVADAPPADDAVAGAAVVETSMVEAATDAPRAEPRRQGRSETRRPDARRDETRRDDGRRDETRRDDGRRPEAKRDDARRDETRRDEARRDDGRRDEARRDEPPRPVDTRPWNERRPRDGRRRDEDLGPSVLGFGDDVPAFMLLRSRGKRPARAEAVASADAE